MLVNEYYKNDDIEIYYPNVDVKIVLVKIKNDLKDLKF
jgi:hypothetical protein